MPNPKSTIYTISWAGLLEREREEKVDRWLKKRSLRYTIFNLLRHSTCLACEYLGWNSESKVQGLIRPHEDSALKSGNFRTNHQFVVTVHKLNYSARRTQGKLIYTRSGRGRYRGLALQRRAKVMIRTDTKRGIQSFTWQTLGSTT